MARALRIQQAGLTYHVWSRGVGGMLIYKDDRDRQEFLTLLARTCEDDDVGCHAFTLMSNHHHLVITTRRANLSHAIRELNSCYARWWNYRHSRSGHVFQGRFGAQVVQDEHYLVAVCLYVALNAPRAGLVEAPEQWAWSSYRATAGMDPAPAFLELAPLWRYLGGGDPETSQAAYRHLAAATLQRKLRLRPDPVLGDESFQARFRDRRAVCSPEVPKRHRRTAEPLASYFTTAFTPRDRELAALAAHRRGYSLVEIAGVAGIHYTTVSKMIKRAADRQTPGSSLDPPVSSARGVALT